MTVTSANEWRKPRTEGVEITFPSGNTAKIRPVTSVLLVKLGRVPNVLMQMVAENLLEGKPLAIDTNKPEQLEAFLKLLDGIAETAFVEPRVVSMEQELKDGEISVEDVSLEDKVWLMGFLNRPATELATFRPEQAGDVELMDTEPRHEPATKRSDAPEPVGG